MTVRAIVRDWGRIGLVGFGGPPAHVALLRELVVERRELLDAREFEDANAACGLLPGPASTQLAIYCAHRAGGVAGAIAGGLAFILPGLVVIIALAGLLLGGSPPSWLAGLAAGAGAAAVAVVVAAGITLGRASLAGRRGALLARALAYIAAGAVATALAGPWVVLVLLGCGVLELALRRGLPRVAGAHAWPGLLLLAATSATELPALAWTALKVGALSYGGGFVIIPLMQGDAVETYGWMSDPQFLDAVALGQLTPGPVTHTVAVVGYAAAGLGGAVLAAAVAFAPSFLVIALGGRRFAALRERRGPRAFLDGAGPAAVGAIIGAAVPLAAGLDEPWQIGVVIVAGVALALGRGALLVLVAGAVVGVILALAGVPLP